MSLSTEKLITIGYDKSLMTDLLFCQLIDLFSQWNFKSSPVKDSDLDEYNVIFLDVDSSTNLSPETWLLNSLNNKEKFSSLTHKKRFDVNFSDSSEIKKLLDLISKSKLIDLKDSFVDTSFSNYKDILSNSHSYLELLKESEEDKQFVKTYIDILQLGFRLTNLKTEKEIILEINEFLHSLNLSFKLRMIVSSEVDENILDIQSHLCLPLLAGEKYLIFDNLSICPQGYLSFILCSIFQEIETFYGKTESRLIDDAHNLMLEEAFSKIDKPMALFSEKGELVLHNTTFSNLQLLPMECRKLDNEEKIEVNGVAYLVRKVDISIEMGTYSFFLFSSEQVMDESDCDSLKSTSSQELGIISSSIAHELNNPLAGILAAISLLELEDDWEDDSIKTLDDMKVSGGRCKELIEIFLGFSKASLQNQTCPNLESSFEQAKSLLNFRMIESSTTFELSYNVDESILNEINSSIITMIFYLLLSEVMTAKAHHNLVVGESALNKNFISGRVIEKKDSLIIDLDDDLRLDKKLKEIKLIQHLVELESMQITIDGSKIILS